MVVFRSSGGHFLGQLRGLLGQRSFPVRGKICWYCPNVTLLQECNRGSPRGAKYLPEGSCQLAPPVLYSRLDRRSGMNGAADSPHDPGVSKVLMFGGVAFRQPAARGVRGCPARGAALRRFVAFHCAPICGTVPFFSRPPPRWRCAGQSAAAPRSGTSQKHHRRNRSHGRSSCTPDLELHRHVGGG